MQISPAKISPLFDPKFTPPYCPNTECAAHRDSKCFKWFRHASYATRLGRVPRFRCRGCWRTFSSSRFKPTYYMKRPLLLEPIACGLVAGSAQRQLARSLSCSHQTVSQLAARLGRHAFLYQARALASQIRITEPVIYDDFETFAYSQDAALGVGTAVGASSFFLYSIEATRHRGPGNLAKRGKPIEPDRFAHGYHNAFKRTLDRLLPLVPKGTSLSLTTDGHTGYLRGLREHPERERVEYRIFKNPKGRKKGQARSAEARLRDAAHFASDLCHKLMRHSLADHRRETIAHGKRHCGVMERIAVFMVWRNFIKHRSERKPGATPAMQLGLTDKPLSWEELLSERLLPSRISLSESWMQIFNRNWVTPELGRNTRHRRVHAT